MAVLCGKDLVHGDYVLKVEPITPTLDGPRDAYEVVLQHQGNIIYHRQHSVYNWQSRHYYIYDIAFAFQSAARLLDQTFDFSIYEADSEHLRRPKQRSSLFVSTDWLEFVLSGQINRYRGPFIVVRLFLEEEKDVSGVLVRGVTARFTCPPEEAEQFGRSLAEECRAAERQRVAKGIPECDEDSSDMLEEQQIPMHGFNEQDEQRSH